MSETDKCFVIRAEPTSHCGAPFLLLAIDSFHLCRHPPAFSLKIKVCYGVPPLTLRLTVIPKTGSKCCSSMLPPDRKKAFFSVVVGAQRLKIRSQTVNKNGWGFMCQVAETCMLSVAAKNDP